MLRPDLKKQNSTKWCTFYDPPVQIMPWQVLNDIFLLHVLVYCTPAYIKVPGEEEDYYQRI